MKRFSNFILFKEPEKFMSNYTNVLMERLLSKSSNHLISKSQRKKTNKVKLLAKHFYNFFLIRNH